MNETRHPKRQKVGMAVYGDLTYDSRVRREAATLARAGYEVSLACLGAEGGQRDDLPADVKVLVLEPTATSVLPGSEIPLYGGRLGRLGTILGRLKWAWAYARNVRAWGRSVVAALGPQDVWHLHDLTALAAVAPQLERHVPAIYDAHELFLDTGTSLNLPGLARSALRAYERRLVARAAAVITVNEALAEVLSRRYRPKRLEVLHNCPDRWPPPARRPQLIRDSAEIPAAAPVLLYHGKLAGDRGIEVLMDALLQPGLENVHLVLMGVGWNRADYVQTAGEARWQDRIHVLDAVLPSDLLPWVASADVGVMPILASTLNHYLSTPNKLFECLAAGIPVVVSDFPAMSEVVARHPGGPLGAVCDPTRVDSVAAAIRSILELDNAAGRALRSRCLAAARTRWNWEAESVRLMALYGAVASGD
jgi:glycosyltransferase involved in cell wall biosynthesis